MSSNRDLESRIADFYAQEGMLRAPDRVLSAALTTIESTRQRRVLGRLFGRVSWRFPNMSNYLKVAVAAVVVIVAVGVGFALYSGRPPAPAGTLSPTASPPPSPTIGPSPSPVGSSRPALTETYVSDAHGISVGYPAGWQVRAATEPWVTGELLQAQPFADVIYEKESDTPFIALTSSPLRDKQLASWTVEFINTRPCGDIEDHTIAGQDGYITECEDGAHAVVGSGGRAYVIWLYRISDFDWFKEILETVQLDPGAALNSSDPFGVPFTFRFPSGPRWDLGTISSTWYEIRVPEYADAGHPGGLIAQVTGGGRTDPCDSSSTALTIEAGAQPVIDYLKTVPDLTVTDESEITIGSLPAAQARVTAGTETPTCEEIWPWMEKTEAFTALPRETTVAHRGVGCRRAARCLHHLWRGRQPGHGRPGRRIDRLDHVHGRQLGD